MKALIFIKNHLDIPVTINNLQLIKTTGLDGALIDITDFNEFSLNNACGTIEFIGSNTKLIARSNEISAVKLTKNN